MPISNFSCPSTSSKVDVTCFNGICQMINYPMLNICSNNRFLAYEHNTWKYPAGDPFNIHRITGSQTEYKYVSFKIYHF